MITKDKKQEVLQGLSEKLSNAKSLVFLGFQGLTVQDGLELRRKMRAEGVELKVAKKTLIKKSLMDAKIKYSENFNPEGPVAVAFGYEDEMAPARLVNEFGKKNTTVQIMGGVMNLELIDAVSMRQIASLPGKQQLRAQLVGTINAPVSGFVNVLAGNVRSLLNVMTAIADSKK